MIPKVSVIIPNYNHIKYLEQRINSVLNQTYKDFELIILDDKSTDNSKDVIELYRNHPKVSKIVYNEVNSGTTFKQWNKGFKLAQGEFIWMAESDDDASEHFLETLVSILEQNKNIGIVYCDSYYINENNIKLKRNHEWKNISFSTDRWLHDYQNSGINEANNYMIYHTIVDNVSCALLRKNTLFKVGLADETFKYAGDHFLYMNMLMVSDIAYISQPLNYFRDHPINKSKEAFLNGSRPLEELLCYTKIVNNKNIFNRTKFKKISQTIEKYRYFAFITLKLNKNLLVFIKGNFRLFKSNFIYSLKLIGYVLTDILRNP